MDIFNQRQILHFEDTVFICVQLLWWLLTSILVVRLLLTMKILSRLLRDILLASVTLKNRCHYVSTEFSLLCLPITCSQKPPNHINNATCCSSINLRTCGSRWSHSSRLLLETVELFSLTFPLWFSSPSLFLMDPTRVFSGWSEILVLSP